MQLAFAEQSVGEKLCISHGIVANFLGEKLTLCGELVGGEGALLPHMPAQLLILI